MKTKARKRAKPSRDDKALAQTVAQHAKDTVDSGNWVGAIQNACIEFKSPLPSYVYGRESSPDHKPTHSCVIDLLGIDAEGQSGSKQEAKRFAAEKWVDAVLNPTTK